MILFPCSFQSMPEADKSALRSCVANSFFIFTYFQSIKGLEYQNGATKMQIKIATVIL